MGTVFDYEKVKEEIELLKDLYNRRVSEYEEFVCNVVEPMMRDDVWAGNRHDRNLESIIRTKNEYELINYKIREQIEYLEYALENYKNTDNMIVKSLDEWALNRL